MSDQFIASVRKFMEAAQQSTRGYDAKGTALYLKLFIEEMQEALDAVAMPHSALRMQSISDTLNALAKGDGIKLVDCNRVELLDAAIDLAWVAIGLAYSLGGDAECAALEVVRSNMSKLQADGTMMKDANGKVCKPAHYSPPDLSPLLT